MRVQTRIAFLLFNQSPPPLEQISKCPPASSSLSFNKRVRGGCRLPPAKTRAAVPSDVWGRELSGRAADSARGLRLKLLKWKVHCSNPLVTGSNPVGGAKNSTDHIGMSQSRPQSLLFENFQSCSIGVHYIQFPDTVISRATPDRVIRRRRVSIDYLFLDESYSTCPKVVSTRSAIGLLGSSPANRRSLLYT